MCAQNYIRSAQHQKYLQNYDVFNSSYYLVKINNNTLTCDIISYLHT